MKKVKYFVLGLLVCFGFGCTYKADSQINIKTLLKNINNVESYQCMRLESSEPFICILRTSIENKLVVCNHNGCTFKDCKDDYFCFQSSNDTE